MEAIWSHLLTSHWHPCHRLHVNIIILSEVRASQLAQASEMGWFSNTSFTTGLKTLPTFRPDALVFFRAKKTRASGRNVGKVFNPVVKLVLENQPISDYFEYSVLHRRVGTAQPTLPVVLDRDLRDLEAGEAQHL